MANKQLLKQRIKSIGTIRKITKAMEMIANAKLLRTRGLMEKNREYSDCIKSTVDEILFNSVDVDNQYLVHSDKTNSAVIIFCNNLGMCGGYTAKLNAKINESLNKGDQIYLIGSKCLKTVRKMGFEPILAMSSDAFGFSNAQEISGDILEKYRSQEVGKLKIIYTEFVNSGTFEPMEMNLLPYESSNVKDSKPSEVIFEPNPNEILNDLIPMMVTNMIYSTFMRAKTAEQAARRLAMESASDNADELKEKLTLSYNQARQQSITQEISEIVAGADAI